MKKEYTKIIRIMAITLVFAYLVLHFPDYTHIVFLTALGIQLVSPLFGIPVTIRDHFPIVEYPDVTRIFSVSAECSGVIIFSLVIFSLFITPEISFKKRMIGLLMIPAIFLGNISRIILDINFARYFSPDLTIFFHDTFGQLFIFFWAIMTFYAWLYLVGELPHEREEYKKLLGFLNKDNN